MAASESCCVPKCGKTRKDNTVLHSFPNVDKDMQRYLAWVRATGIDPSLDPRYVYKNRRVCHDHFGGKDLTWTRRLSPGAVPNLKVPGVPDKVNEGTESSNNESKDNTQPVTITDEKDIVPNKIYKVISVDGEIKLETAEEINTNQNAPAKAENAVPVKTEKAVQVKTEIADKALNENVKANEKTITKIENVEANEKTITKIENVEANETVLTAVENIETNDNFKEDNVNDDFSDRDEVIVAITESSDNEDKGLKMNDVNKVIINKGKEKGTCTKTYTLKKLPRKPTLVGKYRKLIPCRKPVPVCSDPPKSSVDIDVDKSLSSKDSVYLPLFDTRNEESVVKKFVKLDRGSEDKYKTFTSEEDYAVAKTGEPMVLITMAKYVAVSSKLKYLSKSTECKKCKLKQAQTLVDYQELVQLRKLKDCLSKSYSEAQIYMMMYPKTANKHKWTDRELGKFTYLYQIISCKAYIFLKYQLKFPLPALNVLRDWMKSQNISIPLKGKQSTGITKTKLQNSAAEQTQDINVNQVISEHVINPETAQTQYVNESEQTPYATITIDKNAHATLQIDENACKNNQVAYANTETMQIMYADTEMSNAVNSIVEISQVPDITTDNIVEVYSTLSQAQNSEETVHYGNDEYYIPHESTMESTMTIDESQVTQETVQSTQQLVPKRKLANMKLKCNLCMKPFQTEEEVRMHVPIHYFNTYYTNYLDAQKPYHCEFCNSDIQYRTQLVTHHRLHLGINPYKCWHPGCNYITRNQWNLKSHVKMHSSRCVPCGQCARMFRSRLEQRRHARRRHAERAQHTCALCGATCRTRYTYLLHVRAHDKPPRLKCPVEGCEESFYSKLSLRRHKVVHTGDEHPYKCPHCPLAQYTTSWSLRLHLGRHETNKINHCTKCQKIFYDYSEYYAHMKTQHLDKEPKYTCACEEQFNSIKKFCEHKTQCALAVKDTKIRKKKQKPIKRKLETGNSDVNNESGKVKRLKVVKQVVAVRSNEILPVTSKLIVPSNTYKRKYTILEKRELLEKVKSIPSYQITLPAQKLQKVTAIPEKLYQKIVPKLLKQEPVFPVLNAIPQNLESSTQNKEPAEKSKPNVIILSKKSLKPVVISRKVTENYLASSVTTVEVESKEEVVVTQDGANKQQQESSVHEVISHTDMSVIYDEEC